MAAGALHTLSPRKIGFGFERRRLDAGRIRAGEAPRKRVPVPMKGTKGKRGSKRKQVFRFFVCKERGGDAVSLPL